MGLRRTDAAVLPAAAVSAAPIAAAATPVVVSAAQPAAEHAAQHFPAELGEKTLDRGRMRAIGGQGLAQQNAPTCWWQWPGASSSSP